MTTSVRRLASLDILIHAELNQTQRVNNREKREESIGLQTMNCFADKFASRRIVTFVLVSIAIVIDEDTAWSKPDGQLESVKRSMTFLSLSLMIKYIGASRERKATHRSDAVSVQKIVNWLDIIRNDQRADLCLTCSDEEFSTWNKTTNLESEQKKMLCCALLRFFSSISIIDFVCIDHSDYVIW